MLQLPQPGSSTTTSPNGEDAGSEKSQPLPRRRLTILLADDNEFNRRVGRMKLEKRNHAVTVVGSGQEALDALEQTSFDVVLMDVQMPDMDGLEATAAIRRKEETTGQHVPIIAMTAHAMKGDRERFLAAGMDGYVAKPVRDEELWAAIDALTSGEAPAQQQPLTEPTASEPPPSSPPSEAVFDREAVLARVGGNLALLQSLAQVFNKDCASLTSEIRAALEKHQVADGVRPAHTLKGVVGFFGTAAATRASQELEALVKQGDERGASAALGDLLTQIEAIQRNLTELAQERETLVLRS